VGIATLLLNAFHADRTGERFFHVVAPLILGVISFIIAATSTSFGARYFAMMLMPAGTATGYVVNLAWISNTLPRPPAKRAAALAMINSMGSLSHVYSSFMYQDSAAPRYVAAMVVNAVTLFITFLCALTLRNILKNLNRRLSMGGVVDGVTANTNVAESSISEAQKRRGFRYVL
jgi:MFS family permease